ncbi:MAG: hypothetical protein EP330_21665 [Deltaproteobacteria bacterium]|nr:MAG: hypothetical protein EP330_21665 [Deltaproteobacteria bacterium]
MSLLFLLLACGTPATSEEVPVGDDEPVETGSSGPQTAVIADCATAPEFATSWSDCGLQAACAACVEDCPTACAFQEDPQLDTGIGRFHCGDEVWYMPGAYRADACKR